MRLTLALAPIWLCMLLLGYWWYLDYPLLGEPITITGVVHTPEVRPGEDIDAEWMWTVHRDCPRTVELWLMNGQSILLRQHTGSSSGIGGGERSARINIHVPTEAKPGTLTVRSRSEWHCNPLRSWRHVYDMTVQVLPAG